MKTASKVFSIGIFSGMLYTTMEFLFRGRSHWTMFILAFFVGIILMFLNDEVLEYDTPYELQVISGTIVCIVFEFLFGIIFNRSFTIWDYRNMWGTLNFTGNQINIIFCGVWVLVTAFGLILLDWMQWKLGLGQAPYYHSIITGKTYYMSKRR